MDTIICFRQSGNNLRIGNTLVWIESALSWCKKNDMTFWFPNAKKVLGELCDPCSDVFTIPKYWEESILYESEQLGKLLSRVIQTVNEVDNKESISDFAFVCSIVPEVLGYVKPHGNTNWSDVPDDLILFLKRHKVVIVNEPHPFILNESNDRKCLYLQPSDISMQFIRKILMQEKRSIGVHIRQGDYKNWRGGQHYKNSEFYNALIELVYSKFQEEDVNIYIAHDGEFEMSQLSKELITKSNLLLLDSKLSSEIRDFLVLSACNIVVGPISTFSQQALKWGEKNNYCSGKFVQVQSNSGLEDIINKVDLDEN